MGTISRFSSVQFENTNVNELNGVTLVYQSINKNNEVRQSAINFDGDEYCPINDTQDEIFRVWKNVVSTFWEVKAVEAGLRVDNGGISSKLRSGTPCSIIIRSKGSKGCKTWDIESSVWSRIGLVPTKKDLEVCARDFKKKIHAATKASFDALSFRLNFAALDTISNSGADVPAPKNKPAKNVKAA